MTVMALCYGLSVPYSVIQVSILMWVSRIFDDAFWTCEILFSPTITVLCASRHSSQTLTSVSFLSSLFHQLMCLFTHLSAIYPQKSSNSRLNCNIRTKPSIIGEYIYYCAWSIHTTTRHPSSVMSGQGQNFSEDERQAAVSYYRRDNDDM